MRTKQDTIETLTLAQISLRRSIARLEALAARRAKKDRGGK